LTIQGKFTKLGRIHAGKRIIHLKGMMDWIGSTVQSIANVGSKIVSIAATGISKIPKIISAAKGIKDIFK